MALNLTEYGKKARREYNREWERKHKDSQKKRSERYWNRKGEELKARELAEEERGGKNEK